MEHRAADFCYSSRVRARTNKLELDLRALVREVELDPVLVKFVIGSQRGP